MIAGSLPAAGQGTAADAAAQAGFSIHVAGEVDRPLTLGLADLQALPPVTVEVSQATEHGTRAARFTGPLLLLVLGTAGLHDGAGPRSYLQHTLLVRGWDGYAVAVAIGEVDPAFENKQVILAYEQDGEGLAAPRLVVPGDAKAGRSVRGVTAVDVR